jgi:uncharacterized membrane protein
MKNISNEEFFKLLKNGLEKDQEVQFNASLSIKIGKDLDMLIMDYKGAFSLKAYSQDPKIYTLKGEGINLRFPVKANPYSNANKCSDYRNEENSEPSLESIAIPVQLMPNSVLVLENISNIKY